MHVLGVVVGERIDEVLAPFADWVRVEKYRSYLQASRDVPDTFWNAIPCHHCGGISKDDGLDADI